MAILQAIINEMKMTGQIVSIKYFLLNYVAIEGDGGVKDITIKAANRSWLRNQISCYPYCPWNMG